MSNTVAHHEEILVNRQGRRVELKMSSHPSVLRPVRLELEEFGRAAGLSCEQCDRIGLALNEALANVMRHGYGGAMDRPIIVIFERRGDGAGAELEIQIRDWAKPFDPAKLPGDPPPPDPDTVKPGGLGLLCMRRLMDQVVFTPQPDGMLLTMVKKIGTEADDKCSAGK